MFRDEAFTKQFAQILVNQKVLSADKVSEIVSKFSQSSIEEFDAFLIDEGLADHEQILIALEHYCHVPSFDVEGYFFETFLLHKFPKDFLFRNAVIPLEVDENILIVIAAEPERPGLESAMREFVSYDITFLVGIRRDICDAVEEYYDESVTQEDIDSANPVHERDERKLERTLHEDEQEQDEEQEGVMYYDEDGDEIPDDEEEDEDGF